MYVTIILTISVFQPSKIIYSFSSLFFCSKSDEIYAIFLFCAVKIVQFPFCRIGRPPSIKSLHILYHFSEENNCTYANTPDNLQCYESSTDPAGYYFDCISDCDAYNRISCSSGGVVCASDFGSYPNECEMSKFGCEKYGQENVSSLRVTHSGKCQGNFSVKVSTLGPAIFNPLSCIVLDL